MLSVTFNQPIVIDAANLHSLLSLANTPAVVTPYACVEATEEVVPAAKRARVTKRDGAGRIAEVVISGDKPKRTRATKAEMEARRAAEAGGTPADPPAEAAPEEKASAAETTAKPEAAVVADAPAEKPKRDRRSAAKKAADAAAEAAPKEAKKSTGKTTTAADAPDAAGMLDRFAKLIDSDFGKAKAVLDEFGVNRFSDLKVEQHAAFNAKLTELGV